MRRIDLDKLILEAYQEVLSEQNILFEEDTESQIIYLKDLDIKELEDIKTKYLKNKSKEEIKKKKRLPNPEDFDLEKSYINPVLQILYLYTGQGGDTAHGKHEVFYLDKLEEHLSSLNEALSEEDYHRLIELITSANSHLTIYYSPSWNVVNIGGTGYDKGDLVKHFNAKPGTSSTIKNLFYHAAQTPEETKEAVERLSNGTVLVDITDGSLVKYSYNGINESLKKRLSEATEGEDLTDEKEKITLDELMEKFPSLKAAVVKLQTEDFKEFVESIDWISPRPTSFRVNLKNGQDYTLKWTGKAYESNILGKRYILNKIDEYQQALDKLNVLYKEAPLKGAGEELADVDTDTGGGGGGGGDFPGAEPTGGGDEIGGETGEETPEPAADTTGADLTGEPVDFEAPAEEPEV